MTWTNSLCDNTCLVEAFEHEWLRHRSYVLYRKSRIEAAADLIINGERRGLFERRGAMNPQTFLRIRNGIARSPHTPMKIKRYYQERQNS